MKPILTKISGGGIRFADGHYGVHLTGEIMTPTEAEKFERKEFT
jgi:hypothetical protein